MTDFLVSPRRRGGSPGAIASRAQAGGPEGQETRPCRSTPMRIIRRPSICACFPSRASRCYGYVGRLARLHGKASIRAFLRTTRPSLSETQVWRGEAQGAIARLIDLPEDVFLASTFAPT